VGTREKMLRYGAELGGALVIYAITVWISVRLVTSLSTGITRDVAAALPLPGVLLVIWAIVRQFRRMDEYVRRVTLEQLGIAAAVTAGWTMSYGFLENVGFPRLSMFVVWPVMAGVWAVLALVHAARSG
jgi:HEAT repeat protein